MKEKIASLKAGDKTYITGKIYMARDAAHKLMVEEFNKSNKFPFDVQGQIIYYAGPSPAREGQVIGSCGPTTSSRMDKYTPLLLDNGLKAMIGKGERNDAVIESIKKNKAVYFVAIGGAGALIAKCIKSQKVICYPELGAEAVRLLEVENFPVIVGIDSFGNDIYKKNT